MIIGLLVVAKNQFMCKDKQREEWSLNIQEVITAHRSRKLENPIIKRMCHVSRKYNRNIKENPIIKKMCRVLRVARVQQEYQRKSNSKPVAYELGVDRFFYHWYVSD